MSATNSLVTLVVEIVFPFSLVKLPIGISHTVLCRTATPYELLFQHNSKPLWNSLCTVWSIFFKQIECFLKDLSLNALCFFFKLINTSTLWYLHSIWVVTHHILLETRRLSLNTCPICYWSTWKYCLHVMIIGIEFSAQKFG